MHKLGISVYPDKTPKNEVYAYMEKAAKLGYSRIFTCFLSIPDEERESYLVEFKEFMKKAHELGFEVAADTNPQVFDLIGATPGNLKQLEQKNLDIGMVEKPLLIDPEKMYRKKIADDQLVRIGKHTGTWLVREPGSGIAHYTQQFFQEYGIMPEKTIQINRNELIISLVQQDIGETIMSQSVIPNNLPNTIINDHFKRTLYSLTANDLEKSLADKINTLLKQSVPLE